MSDATIRLFVALELPTQVRAALTEVTTQLRHLAPPVVRWVNPAGIHLTLKFIGEVESAEAEPIRAALRAVALTHPLEIAFRALGWFPNVRHPRVLWAGVEAGRDLAELAAAVERALEPSGIAREDREFRPHLTLARIKEPKGLEQLRQEVERLGAPEFGRADYTDFDLMESTLRPQGAVYTRVERFSFIPAAAPAAVARERAP